MTRGWDGPLFATDPDFVNITCPYCGGNDTSVQSLFGSTASEVLIFCEDCRSCFNWVKWRQQLPPLPTSSD